MGNFIVSGIFLGIIGGLIYIYFSIHFDAKSYVKKVRKYRQIQLLKIKIRNSKKRRGS